MSNTPIRRAHLVAPFGVGALVVAPDGTSMLAAGLDHWFERQDGSTAGIDVDEFVFSEWRLEQRLGVGAFRLPPDFRRRRPGGGDLNLEVTLPFLRFPTWHFCWRCRTLEDLPLTVLGRQKCSYCLAGGKTSMLAQVPFVAICDAGHLRDFPWREWVHASASPSCVGRMELLTSGGGTLADQVVVCRDCNQRRSLARIVESDRQLDQTHLSSSLDAQDGVAFLCDGVSPQHGSIGGVEECGRPLHGSLRSASNLYFACVQSAIYLPRVVQGIRPDLRHLLEANRFAVLINDTVRAVRASTQSPDSLIAALLRDKALSIARDDHGADPATSDVQDCLAPFSDAELVEAAYALVDEAGDVSTRTTPGEGSGDETFRLEESDVLRNAQDSEFLTVAAVDPNAYSESTTSWFARVCLVERLRETRVLTGFDRVFPARQATRQDRDRQLWQAEQHERWLPAYMVFGEGIYLEFDETHLQEWEQRNPVIRRLGLLQAHYDTAAATRGLPAREITARLVLVHTFSHMLMTQLTLHCGYSTAALRERLYISSAVSGEPRAAVMIYTAAGDAEGTMGGLVRMGKPGNLENVVTAALSSAAWCASDPVCMEIGSLSGQGPDSCNLAACHTCSLVPETACEEFNRFLDRALLIGSIDDPSLGFMTRTS